MKGTVYAIISTAKSDFYAGLAIDTFLKYTKLGPGDKFYLIDNDAVGAHSDKAVTIIANETPQNFAKNVNKIIALADGKDVVILNNDIAFTSDWSVPLQGYSNCIVVPSCNQTHLYTSDNFTLESAMNIDQYNEYELNNIVRQHKTLVKQGLFERHVIPFYAVKIPANIYKKIGGFDETYGHGGEDVDYRIRAIQAGFGVKYVSQSYLLHFQGKSSWSGAETAQETKQRDTQYYQRFVELWGSDLTNLLLTGGDAKSVADKYQLWNYFQSNDFTGMIKHMLWIKQGNSIVPLDKVSADGLLDYVKKLGNNLVGCELGVCWAWTLRYFLDRSSEINKVYAIDAYQPYQDWWGPVTQDMVDVWRNHAVGLLAPYADRVEMLEMDSIAAADHIADNELDYIFIDGDHSYAAVSRDLRAYWSKVKPGGIFAGHDWNLPEVNRAVNDFRKELDITTEIQHTSKNVWFWYR